MAEDVKTVPPAAAPAQTAPAVPEHPAIQALMCKGCGAGRAYLKIVGHTRGDHCRGENGYYAAAHIHITCSHCKVQDWRAHEFWLGHEIRFHKTKQDFEEAAPITVTPWPKEIQAEACPTCLRRDGTVRVDRRGECLDYPEDHFHFTCKCGWQWRRPIAFWTLPEGLGDPTSIYPRPGWWRRHREDVRGVLRFSIGAALGAGAGFGWWLSRLWP